MQKLIIPLVIVFICPAFSFGQLCSGNLGDPIFTEDFGERGATGPIFGPPLPATQINYNYNNIIYTLFDGDYTITDNMQNGLLAFHNAQDRTPGDTNGYMLLINATDAISPPNEFYRRRVSGLCANTVYEFSVWASNALPNQNVCGPNVILPDMRFEIRSINGDLLEFVETGPIAETSSAQWNQYGILFDLDGESEVDIIVVNNAPGGCGNDLAIDDIELRACGDSASISISSGIDNTFCENEIPDQISLQADLEGNVYETPEFQWQVSINGIDWADLPNEMANTLPLNPFIVTNQYRYKVAETAVNLVNGNCSVISDPFVANTLPTTQSNRTINRCDDQTYVLTRNDSIITTPGNYIDTLEGTNGCDLIEFLTVNYFSSTQENIEPITLCFGQDYPLEGKDSIITTTGNYTDSLTTINGCDSLLYLDITVLEEIRSSLDTLLCFNETYTLSRNDSIINTPGNYVDSLVASNGCDSILTLNIQFAEAPVVQEQLAICPGDSLFFNNQMISQAGIYLDTIENIDICDNILELTLNFYQPEFPQAFTPNGDGDNDSFGLLIPEQCNTIISDYSLQIFDRWGIEIFASNEINNRWLGNTKEGEVALPSVYVYVSIYEINGETIQKNGSITLIR